MGLLGDVAKSMTNLVTLEEYIGEWSIGLGDKEAAKRPSSGSHTQEDNQNYGDRHYPLQRSV